jgi:hypothetical protein
LGIPTVIIQRLELQTVTVQAFMGQGFPDEAPMVIFPVDLFLVNSDLTALKDNINKIIGGLTTWQPKQKTKGIITRVPVTVTGADYEEALHNFNQLFLRNNWGDGLAQTPPTRKRVDWILTGTDLPHDAVIGKGHVMPKGGIVTMEVLATAIAMAGGRPEYLPVAAAAVETITNSEVDMTSSMGQYHGLLVNGPIAKQIRLGCGFGLFGPDPLHPAGGAIGRALWLILQNPGGQVSGLGTIAQYGEMRYTGIVFAENEDGLPKGWTTFAEEYYKHPKGTNSATFFDVRGGGSRGFAHRGSGSEPSFEVEMQESFYRAAASIKEVMGAVPGVPYGTGSGAILLYNSMILNNMAPLGWTKEKIKARLVELLFITPAEVNYRSDVQRACATAKVDINALPARTPMFKDPQYIHFVCAGGDHPTRATWIPQINRLGNVEIKLPRNWNALLKQAEQDLGPLPTT